MNETPVGQAIGIDAVEAMRLAVAQFWDEWGSRYGSMSQDRKTALQAELNSLLEQARGNATISHALGWESVDFDPSAVGLDRPVPAVAQQADGTLWLKTVVPDTAWSKIWPVATNGGGGGVFIKAWSIDFTLETTQELSSNPTYPPPSSAVLPPFTIGGINGWWVYSPQPRNYPYLTYPNQPKVDGTPGGGLVWTDQTSNMPIVCVPLSNLGLPRLCTLSEFWVFAEIAGTSGDFASWENYWLGVGPVGNSAGSAPLASAFSYIAKKKSYNASTHTGTVAGEAGAFPVSGGSTIACVESAANSDNVIALRILPNSAEVYSGTAPTVTVGGVTSSALATCSFDTLRSAMILRGLLMPTNSMRNASDAASWAGATTVQLILTSSANRNGFVDNTGPAWKRLRIDYALAGSNSNGGTGMDAGFTTVAIASGDISGFGAGRNLQVSNAGPLVGIDSTGLADGTRLDITASVDLAVTSLGATSRTPIKGPFDGGGYPSWTIPAGEEVSLKLHLTGSGAPFWKYVGGSAG